MFQFPAFAPVYRCHLFKVTGCPIRKSADQRAFAPPRGLSQLVTSFLASESPGIPRTLLLDFLVSSFNCIYSSVSLQTFSTFDSVTARITADRNLVLLYVSSLQYVKDLRRLCAMRADEGLPSPRPMRAKRHEIAERAASVSFIQLSLPDNL